LNRSKIDGIDRLMIEFIFKNTNFKQGNLGCLTITKILRNTTFNPKQLISYWFIQNHFFVILGKPRLFSLPAISKIKN